MSVKVCFFLPPCRLLYENGITMWLRWKYRGRSLRGKTGSPGWKVYKEHRMVVVIMKQTVTPSPNDYHYPGGHRSQAALWLHALNWIFQETRLCSHFCFIVTGQEGRSGPSESGSPEDSVPNDSMRNWWGDSQTALAGQKAPDHKLSGTGSCLTPKD